MRSLDSFRTGFAHGKFNSGREEGDDFAKRENAILAVNGNFNQGLTLHAGELVKKAQEAKKYKHLTCPKCQQRIRVPRGKGNLRVRCPKCQERFKVRT